MIRKLMQILLLTVYCLLPTAVWAAISTVDSQGGAYSSVKLQSDDKPAVAHFDHKSGELKYSYWTTIGTVTPVNQWIRTVVEEKGVTGYVSLAFYNNKPYISYYHNISKNNSTGSEISDKYGNHMVGALKYAYCATTPCLTPEDWTKVTVAQIGQSENGYTGGFTSLAFDSSGNPRIAYYDFSHKINSSDVKKGALKLAYRVSPGAISISFAASTKKITRGSGSFITDGFVAGNKITTDATLNPGPFTIVSVTATEIVVAETVVDEGPVTKTVVTSWMISTVDTNGGRSASMAIYNNKVMLSYDADEVQKIKYAEASPPFSSWNTSAEIDTAVNTGNLWRDTSIAIHPTTGKPRLIYQYQAQDGGSWSRDCCRGDGPNVIASAVSGSANMSRRDAYYAYCNAADCTVSANWTKVALASGARNLRGYTSSIKITSDGKPRIAYHYWGSRASGLAYHIDNLSQDLHFVECTDTNGTCSSKNITGIDGTGNTGLYSSIVLDSSDNSLISYYDYDANQLKLYHPGSDGDYNNSGITADVSVSDNQTTAQTGLQSGDRFTILFSGATQSCTIDKDNIDTKLKLSNGHSWVRCSGSSTNNNVGVQWSTTYNTNDTLTITVYSGEGGCMPTVEVGDRVSLDGTCILDGSGNPIILQTEIKGNTGVKAPTGAVAYYKMDEGAKMTAYDSAGGHNASLNNGVAWTTGLSGYGLSLDGSNDYLVAPEVPDSNGGKLTIEAWIKPNAFDTGKTVLSKENSYMLASNGQCAIATTGTGWAWYGAGSMSRLQRNYSGNKDIWRQVVCTYDGTTQKVYIDGILDGSMSATGNVKGSRYPFVMGRRELSTNNMPFKGPGRWDDCIECGEAFTNYTGINYYNGKMDEVVLYNTALKESDIEDRFKQFRAQLERADASDSPTVSDVTIMNGYGLQAGDTVAIRFTNETNAPTINAGNINTVLAVTGKTWLDGNNAIGSAVWNTTRFTNDTLLITLSTTGGLPTIATGDIITLSGGVIKEKTGASSITGSTKIRGSYDLNGAVAYWDFESNANDTVGQYNNGTLACSGTGCTNPTYTAGKFGNAMSFVSGTTSQYVSVSNYPDLNPSNITVEAWVKLSTTGADRVILSKNNQYLLRYSSGNNKFSFYLHDGTDWEPSAQSTTLPSLNTWYHVVGTWDGTNQKIYVNGVLENTVTHNFTPASTTNGLEIGKWGSSYMNGLIDEVVIYNRAITADEVKKRSSAKLKYAVAKDAQGTPQAGIQTGDKVIITFDAPTAGTSITSANIDTALALSGSHIWGTIQSAAWNSPANDTLTITLSTTGSPTVAVGDTITLGTTIKDAFNRSITGSIAVGGNFGDNFPAGRIAYYNFDEQSGTTVYDSIGDNHGTLGNSFWKTEGKFKGLYFDGSRYVEILDVAGRTDFNLASYTIDTWVKVPKDLAGGVGVIRRIISQESSDGLTYWKMQLNDNKLELCDSRLSTPCTTAATTIKDGEWHHVVVVRDDSDTGGTANKVLLYIDGVYINPADPSITETGTHAIDNANIQIGRKSDGTEYFYGMVDEIAVYNRALTATEVQSRYRAPIKSAFTSDPYFNSGIQAGNDKVIIRFHGKTNAYVINSGNIGTVLSLSSGSWGTVQSAAWSTYNGITDNTLTITLGSDATVASGATITVIGTSLTDVHGNAISDSFVLSKDFDFNLPEGAAAYWKLENNNDSFAQNDIATNTGTSGACKFSNCYTYGASKYASVTNSYTLNPERITVEAWVNPGSSTTTWAAGNAYFFYGANSVQFYGVAGLRTVRFYVNVGGTWRTLDYTPSSISGWHHYVGTYDGTNLKIYVDGVLQPISPDYPGVINQFDTGVFYLAQPATANNPSISIDDAAVYNRALDATEVLGRYGDYTVTAKAKDTSGGGPGIQAGDTVKISFSGPTNSAAISASNIETVLPLSNAHYWRNGSGQITSAGWSSSVYENDTLTISLANVIGNLPDIAPLDDITIGSPIGSQYRAFTKSAKIGGLFGDNLPASGNKVAYYNFNEQVGTTAYDAIGDNHGTLNTSFWKTEGLFKGLYFDGSRYVEVLDVSGRTDFNLSSYTIDAWVKVPDGLTTGIRQIISQDDGTNYWRMRLNDNRLELCDSRLTAPCNFTATTINDGEWHHVAVVRDDTADEVLFYIDGVNIYTVSSLTETGTHAINANIQLGRKYNSTEYFYGMIDEVVLYNRVLTTTEIQTRYRAPLKVAFTSDPYFNPGIQAGNDKVIIRFHGKTNVATIIDDSNINTILPITGKPTGWGTIQSVAWSTYKFTNDTLTVLLGTGATIAKGDTITTNGTYIKDMYLNSISDSITLSGDFNLNLPNGAVSYWRFDETTGTAASDSFNGNSGTIISTPTWTTGKINNAIQFAGPLTYTKLSAGTASAITTHINYRVNGPQDGQGSAIGTCNSTTSACYTWRASSAVNNEWWKVDFGSSQTMSRIKVYAYTSSTTATYNVQTSPDNITWTDRGSTTTEGWVTFDFSPITARYVRVYETANAGDGALYITEVEVYNDNNGNNYAQVNNSYSLNSERITVEAWAKSGAASWNVTDALVTKASAYKLSTTSGSKNMSFYIYAGGAWRGPATFTADGSFDITQWHHYAGTYDGTNLKIYVDGVLKNTTAYGGVINTTGTTAIYIGSDNGATSYLTGNIDEVAIYNRALTLEEVIGRYGEYGSITAFANDPAPDVSGIQAGDTVEIRFPGPTNGVTIDATNIDNFLALSNLHSWMDGSLAIGSAVWSTRVYENDTLTITLSATTSAPSVSPQDTISMGGAGEINAKYRAATWNPKISGTFGEVLPGTPAAFWKMDENIGNIAFDSVGTNDGTLINSPAWGTGFFNYGLDFNSSTAYMNVGSITLSGDWSIEGWFKYPLPSTATYNSLTGDRRVVVQRSLMKLGTYNSSTSTFVDLDTPYLMSALVAGWHHISAVGDSAANTTKFYIDSVLVGTANHETTATALTTVGNTTAGNEQFGFIDELVVYSSLLTADDVASRYLVFLKEIYAKDTSNGGSGIQNGDQVIVRFDGPTGATPIDAANIDTALQLSSSHSWKDGTGNIGSAVWSTTYKTNDTLTITLSTGTSVPTVAMRDTITLGTIIKDAYVKDITGSMQIGGDFGTNLPDGAVGYWKFDDGTSGSTPTTASDSFNDNNGTLTNTPTWLTTGRFNNALQFTGGTGADADYVVVNNATVLNPGKLTVEAWAKSGAASWNTNATIVSKRDAYILYPVSASKNMLFYVYAGGAWRTVTFTADGSFDITKWHHYTGTYDGTNIKIYVDGVLKNTTAYTGSVSTTDTGNLFIGMDDGTANYLNGDIDEVVLYNRALIPTEIRTRYGAGFSNAVADDNSNKGPNIQANDRVVITFAGETNGPTINAGNINTILPVSGKTWLDGNGAIVSAVWTTTTYTNDTLTITLSGPATYIDTTPAKPTVVVGDIITINGTITDSSNRVIRDTIAISGSFGVTAATMNSAAANDNSGKGPNIQANDRVVITFSGATNAPAINAGNINTILPVSGKTWLDGGGAIVSAAWTTTTNTSDTLTITLSGPATYIDTTPAKPTVVVGDTISIDGTITDPSGKAIVTTGNITGSFGTASTVIPSTAVADDNSSRGPNIQANDRVVITFSGATNAPTINATNINTILPVSGKTWLDGGGAIVSASWNTPTNTVLTITLSGPATYIDTTPARPTVVVGDTISIDGTITDSTGKAIVSTVAISGSFGTASTVIPSTAVADDNSGKGPNIQANDRVVITFSGATNAPAIDATNINTILPLIGSDFSYDFTGTTISNLTYGGTTAGWVYQNGNLRIRNNAAAWDAYVYTNTTFARSSGRAFQAKFYTAANVDAMIGWWGSSITIDTNMYADMLYGIRFSNGTFYIIEDNNNRATVGTYSVATWYDIKIELKATGAKYYYKPTTSQTWILLYDSNYLSESNLRPGVLHYTYASGYYSYTDDWVVESARSWLDGNNSIGGAGWTSGNTILTITLGGPLNYGDSTPAPPTVGVGKRINIDGTVADSSGKAIISNVSIGGSFGTASSVVLNTAAASDASTWGPNIQSGDKVILTFSGATNTPVINAGNIDTILKVTGKTWKDGNNAIGSAVWDSSTQLTITLSGPATQQDTLPVAPTVAAGDTIVIDGTITDTSSNLIISSVAIGGSFGTTSGTVISSAIASDDNGKYGIQAGDKVIITFNGQIGATGDAPPTIDAANINTVLSVSTKTWGSLSGSGAVWSTTTYQNDTLTITLGSDATIDIGNTIVLDNATVKDKYRTPINSSKAISGDFGTPASARAWWKFESNANDSIGNYSGTFTNSGATTTACNTATWTGGRFSNGLCLDGTTAAGDYVTLTNQYNLTANWTIEAWFKWPISTVITNQQKHVIVSSNLTSNENQITIDYQTKQITSCNGATCNYVPNYDLKNLSTGWHHIVAVGTGGSGAAGTTKFYIDGTDVGTSPYKSASHIKYIGNSHDGSRPWSNTIDNIVIYDTALDANTIKNRYGAWPRSAFAYGTAGDTAGIQTGDQVVIRFDQATEGNTISNLDTALSLSGSHIWGSNSTSAWSTTTYSNDTLTITLSTTGTAPTVAKNDTITFNNVIKDHAGRPIYDTITLQGSFDFKIPLGAIAYWKFDTGSGTAFSDSFGSNNGTLTGGVAWDNAMYGTKGVTIDASTKAAALTTPLNMPAQWTIIGWVKTPIYGAMDNALIHSSSDHEHAICIHTGTGNAELGNVSPTSDPGGSMERGTGYYMHRNLKNGWHQIAAVGTGGNGTAGTTKYYINGQPVGSVIGYKAYTAIGALGNNTGAGAHAIGTTIDEISVYNRPLSDAEISQFYGARLKYARANDASGGKFGIDAGDQIVIKYDGETNAPTIDATNIDTVLALTNGHSWRDNGGAGAIGSAVWSTSTYTNDTLTITLSTNILPPTVTTKDTITLDGVTIKDLNRAIKGSIDISGDFDSAAAYYDMDEGAAITATDSVNDNNGTLVGQSSTLPTWVSGYSGSALDFDDTNAQYVTIADNDSFNLTSYTIEAWLKLPATIPSGNYMRIVSQESNTNPTNYWSLAINPLGQLVHCDSLSSFTAPTVSPFTVTSSTTTNGSAIVTTTNNFNTAVVKVGQKITGTGIAGDTYVSSVDSNTQITMSKNATASGTVTLTFSYDMGGLPSGQPSICETVTTKTLNDNKWHFVAVVRDTSTGNFKFFIDHGNCTAGCAPDKTVASSAGSGTHTIAGTVEIGRKNGYTGNPTSSEYFRGTIDNVAIYNYALTDAEVNLHHFLYPSEAHASNTSGLGAGIQANDSVTILFNGETGATAINDLTTLNNALKLPTGKTWGTTFGSAVWSTTYYTNDTLKVTFGTGANMAIGDTITLGNVINDVHGNLIIGSVAITGSFEINSLLGTVAYWRFDEGINDTVSDSVGSYSGTRYTGLGTWVAGKFGSALDFTNTTGYVSLPTVVPLSSSEWTIEAWFYAPLPITGDNRNTLISDGNTQHIIVGDTTGRYLGVYSTADGGGFRSSGYSGMDSLATGWHHLVAVGKNSKTYFYIDGSAVGTAANYQPNVSIVRLGNGRNASAVFSRPFGKIDDVVIYSRALSTAEITQRAAR